MKPNYFLTIIVPTLNEVENIEHFILRIAEVLKKSNYQILFVNALLLKWFY